MTEFSTYLKHNLRDLYGVSRRAVSTNTCTSERSRSGFGISDMRLVVGAIKIHTVPASVKGLAMREDKALIQTHVGYRMLDRIPPGQAFLGKPSVSSLASAQGAALSPPKFGPE
jgi:hypothetical protein